MLTENGLGSLEQLLEQVCEAIQLTPTQHKSAVDKYQAVGRWLGGEVSPLESLATSIYPQGSMAMGLTVRPHGRLEHDLDLIFEIERVEVSPLQLHNIVDARLRENELYAARLVVPAPARCLRLSHAGDFHLDIVPSRKNPTLGSTAIEVPDRELRCWVPNDPLSYQAWFEERSVTLAILEKAEPRPVPGLVPSEQKPALKLAVQLINRNFRFDASDCDTHSSPLRCSANDRAFPRVSV